MGAFSAASAEKLARAHPELRALFAVVVRDFDCTVLESTRTLEQQQENVRRGVSKTLDSKHLPDRTGIAWAVDVAPYPLQWPNRDSQNYIKDLARWYYFGGFVLGIARQMGLKVRWGGDWDGDRDIHDQSFDDLPHWEVVP